MEIYIDFVQRYREILYFHQNNYRSEPSIVPLIFELKQKRELGGGIMMGFTQTC